MKLVIQRVTSAHVSVKKETVGKIENGLFILVGIKKGDSQKKVIELVEKLVKLRVMSDENSKMNLSILDTQKDILAVSQFTLYADTTGGNRPSFIEAEEPIKARELYNLFVDSLKNKGIKVQTGSFGEYMDIAVQLDGPVTILLEN